MIILLLELFYEIRFSYKLSRNKIRLILYIPLNCLFHHLICNDLIICTMYHRIFILKLLSNINNIAVIKLCGDYKIIR